MEERRRMPHTEKHPALVDIDHPTEILSLESMTEPTSEIPAQLTKIFKPPNSSAALSIIFAHSRGSLISSGLNIAAAPIELRWHFPRARAISAGRTLAPSSRKGEPSLLPVHWRRRSRRPTRLVVFPQTITSFLSVPDADRGGDSTPMIQRHSFRVRDTGSRATLESRALRLQYHLLRLSVGCGRVFPAPVQVAQ